MMNLFTTLEFRIEPNYNELNTITLGSREECLWYLYAKHDKHRIITDIKIINRFNESSEIIELSDVLKEIKSL